MNKDTWYAAYVLAWIGLGVAIWPLPFPRFLAAQLFALGLLFLGEGKASAFSESKKEDAKDDVDFPDV